MSSSSGDEQPGGASGRPMTWNDKRRNSAGADGIARLRKALRALAQGFPRPGRLRKAAKLPERWPGQQDVGRGFVSGLLAISSGF